MAICNVFYTLTKKTGTFLTFSQYLEDLSKWNTESSYHRVVPSKFIALQLPQNQAEETGMNSKLPKLLQDRFENGCAIYRGSMGSGWTPEHSKSLFWDTMLDVLGVDQQTDRKTIPAIKYVGDINLQSYNEHNGMGYSEIYCHIPNDAQEYVYSYDIEESNTAEIFTRGANSLLEGYQEGEFNGWEKLESETIYSVNNNYKFSWDDATLATTKIANSASYQVNAIIVLYDIYNQDVKEAQSIPLGLYVTGLYDENGVMQNSITKYVCNEDIYNSGTAYGLRICSRYVATPHTDNYIVKDVEVDNGGYSDTSRVLSKIAESQSKMDEVVSKAYSCYQQHKDTLAIFKNNRTNVPYIKIINGESYWFVNGRVINQSTDDTGCNSYTMDELRNLMGIGQGLRISPSISETVYDITSTDPVSVNFSWETTYEGRVILPDSVTLIIKQGNTIKGEYDVTRTTGYTHVLSATEDNPHQNTTYLLNVKYRNMVASTSFEVIFTNPTYFGLIDCEEVVTGNGSSGTVSIDWDCISGMDHRIAINWETQSKPFDKLNKFIDEHPINIEDRATKHICLAYPLLTSDNESTPEVESISDENGYIYYIKDTDTGYINDYTKFTTFNAHDKNVGYVVYISNVCSNVVNYKLKFK